MELNEMALARAETHPGFSDADYLRFERFAQDKHEFIDGSVYAMAGKSPNHSTVCFNLHGLIHNQLRGKPCRGYSPNMKVATNEPELFSYPDLMIVCGQPTYHDKTSDVVTNPTVVFEVLSPSTESYDRGEKFLRYTNNIASLEDYVLIAKGSPHAELYSRTSGLKKVEIDGLDSILKLETVECEIPLSELYDRIEFPA